MKQLHLAIIRQRFTPFGGAERIIARTLETLQARGVRVTMITRKWEGADSFEHVVCAPFHIGRLWRDRSFERCACNVVARGGFDLVQSHTRVACCDLHRAGDGLHRVWLQERRRAVGWPQRLALTVSPYHRYLLDAERRVFTNPRIRAIVCNSEMVRNEIATHFDVPAEKLHVIYSGVDTNAFHPRLRDEHRAATRQRYAVPADAPLFLFVGSGFLRKGVGQALSALARQPDGVHLMVVGYDRKTRWFERQARVLGIDQWVRFVGPQRDVGPFYGAADALVLPTLYDPFPNAALEAMAAGLPVITSTKSGAAELIEEGRNGFVRDALDVDGLAQAMGQLSDGERAASMGEAARITVEPLTMERMSDCLLALYEELLRTKLEAR
ncbi:MAG: glycosyltransferase family 4 protein [Gammaproteobacteria bacterium]